MNGRLRLDEPRFEDGERGLGAGARETPLEAAGGGRGVKWAIGHQSQDAGQIGQQTGRLRQRFSVAEV